MKLSIILSLYNCEKYIEKYFEDALSQKGVENIEFSIIHNNPTQKEKDIIESYKNRLNIVYTAVDLEPLYKSWNRAIEQSSGKYLACWNVDDLRTPDSVEKMAKVLDENDDIGFTYGDIIIVDEFGKKSGKYIRAPEWSFELGTTGAIGGPFFMWKKELINKVGYFDEQFKSGADFDYTVRLSLCSKGKKTNALVGYFTNERKGLSTSNLNGVEIQPLERTVIEMRYGIWSKVDVKYIPEALDYRITHILQPDGWCHISDFVTNYKELVRRRTYKFYYVPFSIVKYKVIAILRQLKRRWIAR